MNHPALTLLSSLLYFLQSTMDELRERVAAPTFQKFTDLVAELEQSVAHPETLGLTDMSVPRDIELPTMLQNLLDTALAEIQSRATVDAEAAARADRIAAAVDRIANSLAPVTIAQR